MNSQAQECSICFESITSDTAFKGMQCDHLFHPECLTEFIKQYEPEKKIHGCPSCNRPYNFKLLINDQPSEEAQIAANQKKYDEFKSNVACAICYQDYISESNLPTSLPDCNHIYHQACIEKWLTECGEQQKSGKCPQCKRVFSKINLKSRNDIFSNLLKLRIQSLPTTPFTVLIVDFNNKLKPVVISKRTSVLEFSQSVSDQLNIEKEQLFFSFKGKQFSLKESNKLLLDYDISVKEKIQVTSRFNGGEQ